MEILVATPNFHVKLSESVRCWISLVLLKQSLVYQLRARPSLLYSGRIYNIAKVTFDSVVTCPFSSTYSGTYLTV